MISKLRELLGGALGAAGLETTSDLWQLAEVWSGALGARIAAKATPVRLVRGELLVAVADAVWRQELALLTSDIASRLNRAVGRDVVQRIRLIGGDVSLEASRARRKPERRRLEVDSSATPEHAGRRPERQAPDEAAGDVAAALRSLAAKRNERLVADGALRRPRSRT